MGGVIGVNGHKKGAICGTLGVGQPPFESWMTQSGNGEKERNTRYFAWD